MQELGKGEVNSGSCQIGDTTFINIYRIEELIKVTIHELIHAFRYDNFRDSPQIIRHYQKKYNIFLNISIQMKHILNYGPI